MFERNEGASSAASSLREPADFRTTATARVSCESQESGALVPLIGFFYSCKKKEAKDLSAGSFANSSSEGTECDLGNGFCGGQDEVLSSVQVFNDCGSRDQVLSWDFDSTPHHGNGCGGIFRKA